MTDYEFWHKDPDLIILFHKEYYRRIHDESHIQGGYFFAAISTALGNAFKKKGALDKPYMPKAQDPFKEKATRKGLHKARERAKAQISWLNSVSYN